MWRVPCERSDYARDDPRLAAPSSGDADLYEGRSHLYALAFSYRDVPAEVARLADWTRQFAEREPARILELAAGPGDHAIEFARRGAWAATLDLAPGMCRRAQSSAEAAGVPLSVHCGDMIDFDLDVRVDLAFTLINSLSHVHTLDELIRHFAAVHTALAPGGLYVIELGHPRDFLGRGARATGVSEPWTVTHDGVSLTVRWGQPDDRYDATTQLFHASVDMQLTRGQETEVVQATVVMRDWTLDEVRAASRLAGGGLTQVACFGDFEGGDLEHDDAWRALFVFRRAA